MSKIRTWILTVAGLLLLLYILVAARLIAPARAQCYAKPVDIHIVDSAAHPYVKAAEIRQLLLLNHLLEDSFRLDELPLQAVEDVVNSHPLVKHAEVYSRPSGYWCIDVWQRLPLLRVIPRDKSQFFIDDRGEVMHLQTYKLGTVVDLPVVTGSVSEKDSTLLASLFDLAQYLADDEFWNDMITQMDIHPDGRMSMYLRLCDFEVAFGPLQRIEEKMDILRSFYEDALPKLGWNRYEKISLEFDNQIVCTKKG